ncbi:MAG: hypothetical protein ACRBF0_10100 [Calditrichia bacterium]
MSERKHIKVQLLPAPLNKLYHTTISVDKTIKDIINYLIEEGLLVGSSDQQYIVDLYEDKKSIYLDQDKTLEELQIKNNSIIRVYPYLPGGEDVERSIEIGVEVKESVIITGDQTYIDNTNMSEPTPKDAASRSIFDRIVGGPGLKLLGVLGLLLGNAFLVWWPFSENLNLGQYANKMEMGIIVGWEKPAEIMPTRYLLEAKSLDEEITLLESLVAGKKQVGYMLVDITPEAISGIIKEYRIRVIVKGDTISQTEWFRVKSESN